MTLRFAGEVMKRCCSAWGIRRRTRTVSCQVSSPWACWARCCARSPASRSNRRSASRGSSAGIVDVPQERLRFREHRLNGQAQLCGDFLRRPFDTHVHINALAPAPAIGIRSFEKPHIMSPLWFSIFRLSYDPAIRMRGDLLVHHLTASGSLLQPGDPADFILRLRSPYSICKVCIARGRGTPMPPFPPGDPPQHGGLVDAGIRRSDNEGRADADSLHNRPLQLRGEFPSTTCSAHCSRLFSCCPFTAHGLVPTPLFWPLPPNPAFAALMEGPALPAAAARNRRGRSTSVGQRHWASAPTLGSSVLAATAGTAPVAPRGRAGTTDAPGPRRGAVGSRANRPVATRTRHMVAWRRWHRASSPCTRHTRRTAAVVAPGGCAGPASVGGRSGALWSGACGP